MTLVEQNTHAKENARDKQRRESLQKLDGSRILDPDGPFRRK